MPRKKNDTPVESDLAKRLNILEHYITARGLRHTPERKIVLENLMNLAPRFTVDDVETAMDKVKARVSRGTIVNTLKLCVAAGIVLPAGNKGRFSLYQLTPLRKHRPNLRTRLPFRIFLQCTKCGNIKEIRDREATAALSSKHYNSFSPVSGLVSIYGLCTKCFETNKK